MQNLAMLYFLPEVSVGHGLFGNTDGNSGFFNADRTCAVTEDLVDVTDLAREIGFQRTTVVVTRAVHIDCQQLQIDASAPSDEERDGALIALLFRAASALRAQFRPTPVVFFTMYSSFNGSVKRVAYSIAADAGPRGESRVTIGFADEH